MPFSSQHLFFDLDRTLWDFDKNSELTLRQLYSQEELEDQIGDFSKFYEQYLYKNAHLWKLYGKGKVKKEELRYERFRSTLKHFKLNDEPLVERISDAYVELSRVRLRYFLIPLKHSRT